jgi:hypothetical protein
MGVDRMSRDLRAVILVSSVFLVVASGCAHVQLRSNTVHQAGTLSDIYQQQALDNVAKFVYDINSLPHFCVASEGAAKVADQFSGGGNGSWTAGGILSALGFTVSGQRSMDEGWTMLPVSDPRKLQLMQCAYQRAVSACIGYKAESHQCPDCTKLVNRYYMGNPDVSFQDAVRRERARAEGNDTQKATSESPQKDPKDLVWTNVECLEHDCCWFEVCCQKCMVKKCQKCRGCLVGEYNGVCVLVHKGEGQKMLSKLTLVILDFAIYDAAKMQTSDGGDQLGKVRAFDYPQGAPAAERTRDQSMQSGSILQFRQRLGTIGY